ncbi:MAG: RibD family protein [Geminicoccaceae bacterium]|nr:MAG: RibD family protein [Geminicoccaceae bacterium]
MTPTAPTTWPGLLATRRWIDAGGEPPPAADDPLAQLFHPLAACPKGRGFVVAHLGQSLDGRIATASGHSHYIGGHESLVHLHRLRALVDAVVIGVGTALADAPRLTVRHVEGPNPVRVVIDPRGRLDADASLVSDGLAPTLVVRSEVATTALPGTVEVLTLPADAAGRLPPEDVRAALAARGLTRLLIEGGGLTVSAFVAAGVVDRLQFAVAPLLIGSGRPALSLPAIATLDEALRPPCRRFDLGTDTLYEFDLSAQHSA